MTYNKPLTQAINARDVILARAALIGYVDNDANLSPMVALGTADMVNADFEQIGLQLYEKDDGRTSLTMDANVDASTWNKVKASMYLNFSRKKIDFATKIAQQLREKKVSEFQPRDINRHNCSERKCQDGATSSWNHGGQRNRSTSHPRVTITKNRSSAQQSVVVGVVVAGAVVGGVVGAVVGATLAGVVIGGAVAGGVSYWKSK